MPQQLPLSPSTGVLVGPSFRSSRGPLICMLRASTSSEPEPSGQATDNLQRAIQSLGRKQKILDVANEVLDSLLMVERKPSPSKIAKAKRDVAEAKRDVAEAERNVAKAERNVAKAKRDVAEAERNVAKAALEAFLKNNPRPLSSDVAATSDFDVNEGRLKYNLAEAEWNLSRTDLAFAQAINAPDIDLEQKRKAEEVCRAAFERLVIAPSPGLSTFLYFFTSLR